MTIRQSRTNLTILLALLGGIGLWPGGARAQLCQELLGNGVYRCMIQPDEGDAFEDCFTISSPGSISADFDLSTAVLGRDFGCSCKFRGTFQNHQDDHSKKFHCVTASPSAPLVSDPPPTLGLDAKAVDVSTIGKGRMLDESGNSWIFKCQLDPECTF